MVLEVTLFHLEILRQYVSVWMRFHLTSSHSPAPVVTNLPTWHLSRLLVCADRFLFTLTESFVTPLLRGQLQACDVQTQPI